LVGIAAGWRTDPGKPKMAMATATSLENDGSQSRRRVQDADRHVGMRLRERRMTLGMTQQQLAELIEVTYQQAHKYETGLNRLAAGQLWRMAKGLGVEVDYFFAGLGSQPALKPTRRQLLLLKLTRSFLAIPDPRRQAVLCDVARALVSLERTREGEPTVAVAVVPAGPPVDDADEARPS
jgi:transcriptional regulator with XRE-family HTH domain